MKVEAFLKDKDQHLHKFITPNFYEIKFVLNEIKNHFSDQIDSLFIFEEKVDKDFTLHIEKCDKKEKILKDENHKKAKIEKFRSTLGFSDLWKHITKIIQTQKIPVIGHNFFTDLLFIFGNL